MARGRDAALTSACPVPGTNRSLRYWRAGMQQHREGVAGLQICKSVSGSVGREQVWVHLSLTFSHSEG